MRKKYIIQIDKDRSYPFDSWKGPQFDHIVRVHFLQLSTMQINQISQNINLLFQINSIALMNLLVIREIKEKGFIVDYEFVSQSLKTTQRLNEPSFIAQIKCKVYMMFQVLSEAGIRCFPAVDDIGLTSEGEPKIYLKLDFEVCGKDKRSLLEEYQNWNQQLFSTLTNMRESTIIHSELTLISEYSQKLNKKLHQIQQKLGIIKANHHFESDVKTHPKVKKNFVLQYLPAKKMRNNSFTQGSSTFDAFDHNNTQKNHRSSFQDSKTVSQHRNSSTKDDRLAKRITEAFEKTQSAFKLYEKYQKQCRRECK